MKTVLLLILMVCATVSEACYLSGGGRFQVDEQTVLYARFSEFPPAVSEHFSLYLLICRNDQPWSPAVVKLDATMPDHGHGMNYYPDIVRVDTGRYEVNGLLLHMPGLWQFDIDLKHNSKRQNIQFDLKL